MKGDDNDAIWLPHGTARAEADELSRTLRPRSQGTRSYVAPPEPKSRSSLGCRAAGHQDLPECCHPLSSTIIAGHKTKEDGSQTSNAPSIDVRCKGGPLLHALATPPGPGPSPTHASTAPALTPPHCHTVAAPQPRLDWHRIARRLIARRS